MAGGITTGCFWVNRFVILLYHSAIYATIFQQPNKNKMLKKLFKRKSRKKALILWFKELGIKDVPLVGGKNASLGEMYQNLTKKKVLIPNGFAVTAYAYHYFTEKAGIKDDIKRILRTLDIHNIDDSHHHLPDI